MLLPQALAVMVLPLGLLGMGHQLGEVLQPGKLSLVPFCRAQAQKRLK